MPPLLAGNRPNPYEQIYGQGLLSRLSDNPYASFFSGNEQSEGLLGRAVISPQLQGNQGLSFRANAIFQNAFQSYGNLVAQGILGGSTPTRFEDFLSARNSQRGSLAREIADSNLRQSGAFARSTQGSRGSGLRVLSRAY